ncbi:lec-8, partial [Pristionchus pacificus]|uniref:Galectin n=1 Tax=Pristionchus pacificus TaxID=54126 RepID=A0A2A6BK33_PRIPA
WGGVHTVKLHLVYKVTKREDKPRRIHSLSTTTMHVVHNVPVPSVIPMHEGFTGNARIDVHAHIHHGYERFTVELLSAHHVVLHVDFRFGYMGETIVVMNSHIHGVWGEEMRVVNPVGHGDFLLTIRAHHSHYEISVNGIHIAHFHHRLPMECVQALGLAGFGEVRSIHFTGFPFATAWGDHCEDHFGHAGWIGYGTVDYIAPVIVAGHRYHSYY